MSSEGSKDNDDMKIDENADKIATGSEVEGSYDEGTSSKVES